MSARRGEEYVNIFLGGKSCDAFVQPAIFSLPGNRASVQKLVYFSNLFLSISEHKDFVTVAVEKNVMATNNRGLNLT